MFFIRIDEWGWAEAPPRVPMFGGDLPRLDRPLPSALDDAAAARLLRAAQADRRMLVRVAVEVLLRTGLRVSEFTGLPAGAIVLIGAGHWLHVPAGKLGEDRYLPLHPHLVTLIDDYRTAHVDPSNPLLLPRENGRALDRHTVTRMINKAGTAAGLPHIHPHQLRHTLATQAKMGRIASDASFGSWREHALPAAQRAGLRSQSAAGTPCSWRDLGFHPLSAPDATVMHLVSLRGLHHRCGCRHRDASESA
jgi:integrase